mmetsp:Transcript_95574/g.274266  ORF Transcript_95574/g.274266 Transcript_95574/m.274266 type:complete len:311 (-) Transcript_95574:582-1514(-)
MASPREAFLSKTSRRSQWLARVLVALTLVGAACSSLPYKHAFVGSRVADARPRATVIPRREAPSVVVDLAPELMFMKRDRSGPVQMMGPKFWDEVEQQGLQQVLASNKGIVQVLNLLPGVLASQTLARLQGLSEHEWTQENNKGTILDQAIDSLTSVLRGPGKTAEYSYATHNGHAIKGAAGVIESLVGDAVLNLKAARYQKSNRIAKHGDTGSSIAGMFTRTPDGQHIPVGTKLRRKFAFIWYLTRDWKETYGGCLVDHGSGDARTIVPQFNSAVIFEVPRDHEVTEMVEGSPSRYTVFGWFYEVVPAS